MVWRKPEEPRPEADIREIKDLMLREGLEWAKKVLGRYYGRDLFFTTFAKILSVATRYRKLTDMMGELDAARLVREYVTPLTGRALVSAVSGNPSSGGEVIADPLAQFYLLVKMLFTAKGVGKLPKRKMVDKNDIILLTLATGMKRDEPINAKLLKKLKRPSGAYALLEPLSDAPEELAKFLEERGISPVGLEPEDRAMSSVDILHIMEYVVKSRANPERVLRELREAYPAEYSTATALAQALIRALPDDDVEKQICEKLLLVMWG